MTDTQQTDCPISALTLKKLEELQVNSQRFEGQCERIFHILTPFTLNNIVEQFFTTEQLLDWHSSDYRKFFALTHYDIVSLCGKHASKTKTAAIYYNNAETQEAVRAANNVCYSKIIDLYDKILYKIPTMHAIVYVIEANRSGTSTWKQSQKAIHTLNQYACESVIRYLQTTRFPNSEHYPKCQHSNNIQSSDITKTLFVHSKLMSHCAHKLHLFTIDNISAIYDESLLSPTIYLKKFLLLINNDIIYALRSNDYSLAYANRISMKDFIDAYDECLYNVNEIAVIQYIIYSHQSGYISIKESCIQYKKDPSNFAQNVDSTSMEHAKYFYANNNNLDNNMANTNNKDNCYQNMLFHTRQLDIDISGKPTLTHAEKQYICSTPPLKWELSSPTLLYRISQGMMKVNDIMRVYKNDDSEFKAQFRLMTNHDIIYAISGEGRNNIKNAVPYEMLETWCGKFICDFDDVTQPLYIIYSHQSGHQSFSESYNNYVEDHDSFISGINDTSIEEARTHQDGQYFSCNADYMC